MSDTTVLASDDEILSNANDFMARAGAMIVEIEAAFDAAMSCRAAPLVWRVPRYRFTAASTSELRRRAAELDSASDDPSRRALLPRSVSSVLRFAQLDACTFGTRVDRALVRVLATGQLVVSPRATAADVVAFVLAAMHTRDHTAPRLYETLRFLRLFLVDYVDDDFIDDDDDGSDVRVVEECALTCSTARHFRFTATNDDASFVRAPRGALARICAGHYGTCDTPLQFVVLDDGAVVVSQQCYANDIVAFVVACVRAEERHRGVSASATATRHLISYIDDDDAALCELDAFEHESAEEAFEWCRV